MTGEYITFLGALRERIADVLTRTTTDRVVIEDLTMSIQAAQAWTRVVTLLIDAS